MAVADRERLAAALASALQTLENERTTARTSAESANCEMRQHYVFGLMVLDSIAPVFCPEHGFACRS